MIKKFKTISFCAVFLVFCCGLSVVAQNKAAEFQNDFSAENSIANPIKIPAAVIKSIRRFEDNLADGAKFEGAAVNLDDDGKPDLLVQGDAGANITGFWVFRNVKGAYQMVLAARAHDLAIEKSKTKQIKNINIAAMSAVTLWETTYRFNGTKYAAAICTELDMTTENAKRKNFKCTENSVKPYR